MSTTSLDELTPTSYAMLGLLALRPWTTYELAKQMQRSLRWFWPRAERKLYEEPKNLARLGLASTSLAMTGKRPSTVYEITSKGRAALGNWVGTLEFAPPVVEMEGLIHVFFAENGTRSQMLATIGKVGLDSAAVIDELGALGAEVAAGADAFPDRRAVNALSMELSLRVHEAIRDWSTWAETEVASWPVIRKGRRSVAAGPRERGAELFAAIAQRSRGDR